MFGSSTNFREPVTLGFQEPITLGDITGILAIVVMEAEENSMSVVANRFLLMCITVVRLSSLFHGISKLLLETVFNGSYLTAKCDPLHFVELQRTD